MNIIMMMMMVLLTLPPSRAILHPQDFYTARLGGDAIFTCSPSMATGVEWLLNGTSLNNTQFIQTFHPNGGGALRINNVSADFNNTRVQCFAITNSSIDEEPSRHAILYVQGAPTSVESLHANSDGRNIFFDWKDPFSRNFTAENSTITFCVDVANSTASLYSECNIAETEFSYPLSNENWCENFTFTVTPVNVVGNGTSRSVPFSLALPNPIVVSTTPFSMTNYTLMMSAPVCSANLYIVEVNTKRVFPVEGTNLSIAEASITFFTRELSDSHHYIIIVNASNIAGSSLSETSITTTNSSNGITPTTPRTPGPTTSCDPLIKAVCVLSGVIVVGVLFGVTMAVLLVVRKMKKSRQYKSKRKRLTYIIKGDQRGKKCIIEIRCACNYTHTVLNKDNLSDTFVMNHDINEEMHPLIQPGDDEEIVSTDEEAA